MAPKRIPEKSAKDTSVDDDTVFKLQQEVEELKKQLDISDQQYVDSHQKSQLACKEMADGIDQLRQHTDLEREELVKHYQERINVIVDNRDSMISLLQEKLRDSNREMDLMSRRANTPIISENVQRQVQDNADSIASPHVNSLNARQLNYENHYGNKNGQSRSFDIPLPRQLIFDGKLSWDSFIKPFESQSVQCRWSEEDKLFRLVSSLRGDAAEYAFNQLSSQTLQSYELLKNALDVRFKERRTASSFLNELEGRKHAQKEKLSEYAADIKRLVIKGYPTADEQTRETISVRHFLKGFHDQQMAVAVGMREPNTVNEAREMVETYNSLKDDVTRVNKIRAIQPEKESQQWSNKPKQQNSRKQEKKYMTEDEVQKLIADAIKQREKGTTDTRNQRGISKANIECYRCHRFGHYANECYDKLQENVNNQEN